MKHLCCAILLSLSALAASATPPPSDVATFTAIGRASFLVDTLYTDGHHEYLAEVNLILPDVAANSAVQFQGLCLNTANCAQSNWSYLLGSCTKSTVTTNNPSAFITSITISQCVNPHYAECLRVEGFSITPTPRISSIDRDSGAGCLF